MKKLLSLFLIVCVLVSTFAFSVSASDLLITVNCTSKDGLWEYYQSEDTDYIYNSWLNVYQKETYKVYRLSKYYGNESAVTLPTEIDGNKITGVGQLKGTITNINVPVSYNYIENAAFKNVEGLKTVTFSNEYSLTEGFKFFGIAVDGCKTLKKVVLPNVFQYEPAIQADGGELPADTFLNCKKLTQVVFPKNIYLNRIEMEAFKNCKSLKSITIPEGVTYIGDEAFSGCVSLEKVILPESLEELRTSFMNTSLKEINIPNGLNLKYADYYFPKTAKYLINVESDAYKEFKEKGYSISPVISNNYDINSDNSSNILDVSIFQKYLANIEISSFNEDIADFNSDGSIDISDVTYLQKILCLAILK
jgi:hypothetical protein